MTACLVGTYDRNHSANRLLREALRDAGFVVEELHEPLWEETRTKGRSYFGPVSALRLGIRYLGIVRRLARRWRRRAGPAPLVVVGFGGQLDLLVARRVCRPRLGLLFAPLVSLTDTLVVDRQWFAADSVMGRLLGQVDRRTLAGADLVLADTEAHAVYLRALAAGTAEIASWPLGVEPEFRQRHVAAPEPGRVLFYGRHVPLHGVDTIVAAMGRLGARARLTIIGDGPERAASEALARRLGVPVDWRPEVSIEALAEELARAAVVLGIFGDGPKAAMVVPNKVWQAAAAGRPLVTRDGPALREVFEPGVHCLVCPAADPVALADAIGRLIDDAPLATRLGDAAARHVRDQYGPRARAQRLAGLLASRLGVDPRTLGGAEEPV